MMLATEECAPLTCNQINGGDITDDAVTNNGHNSFSFSYNSDEDDDDDDAGCTDYKHANRFRTGKYNGYCTLGRVSMHDSWDFDKSNGELNDKYSHHVSADSDGDDEDNGEFISFWGQNDGDDDSSSSCSDSEKQTQPQHQFDPSDDEDDDRVETTMRPIPLQYRKYQLGMMQNDPSDNKGSWFQREQGLANLHFNEKEASGTSPRRRWGWGRRRQQTSTDFDDDFDNSEDEGVGGDTNSLLASSSSDDIMGNCIPTPALQERQPSFRFNLGLQDEAATTKRHRHDNNIFGGKNNRRGILALPIVRPFLRGSRRGFADNSDANSPSEMDEDDEDNNNIAGYAEDDMPSRRDRAAVVQSISQGIAGTNDDSLLLDTNNGGDNSVKQSTTNNNPPPNFLQRIFLTRFLQTPDGNNQHNQGQITQLHELLRKEDWSLATTLLESNPELAQTWHRVDRLYGGRYDGEALPIHAACALRPPPAFIERLASLYPEGLLEKDKSFGRIPLHVACRSLAESRVIKVLCEMDPKCADVTDSLKRVPLHYLIKNYCTFGDDDDEISSTDDEDGAEDNDDTNEEEDGMRAMKILIKTSPNCVHVADHRGWLPIHVACSCSSRKGMIRVLKVLLKVWPESINVKTEKDSDVIACVDMAGKHHPTKDRVISFLREAKTCELDDDNDTEDNIEVVAVPQHGDHHLESSSEPSGEDAPVAPSCCELQSEIQSEKSDDEVADHQSIVSSSGETQPTMPSREEDECLVTL